MFTDARLGRTLTLTGGRELRMPWPELEPARVIWGRSRGAVSSPAESFRPAFLPGLQWPLTPSSSRDRPEALMSSWSPEPGMWALSQVGLAQALGLVAACPLGPSEASGQPVLRLCAFVRACGLGV